MDALKETELNKAFLESIYNMYERNINVFVFDAPCWIDGFPYSKSALRRKKMGVEASFPQMVKDIIKWESDLKEIFQEKYSVEYVKKIRNSVKTIKVSGKYVREDYISELINYIGGKRVTCYQPQEYSKTLHIYGRCIVTGTFVEDADTFPSRFQKLLTDHGHSDIRVVNHGIPGDPEHVIMKHNIIMDSPDYKDDDIVMIMDDWHQVKKTLESINVQVTDLSAHWPVNDITVSQFFHNPVHMGYKGYDLLAGIVYKIFIDNFGKKGEGIYKIKKPTDYPFSMKKYIAAEETEKDIEKGVSEYTGKILRDHPLTESIKKIGAVVMNCNPFTFGHRHLIEYASKNVDRLYVFCVEEDRSFFRFEDRIDMIRKGTSDLKNVIVIPSGRFIISTTTFPEYFEKENIEDEKVDVTEDLTIFCKKIAPKLGITKRFAGEEPFDPVTGQYNEKMREMLPENGLEFEAIPRKRSEGSDVISATTVRQLMAQKEYEKLLSFVPETTYDIIMEKYVYQKKNKITEKEMIIRDRSELPPEISVVIPMYNCEQFVPKLLKMFSEQSFTDFEVICVIDGATDGTEEAVKEYCKTDDRFRYVVRENGGAGAARNTGIEEAKGKYIVFSDADDEYSADYLKVLYETAEKNNAQIVISRFEENECTKSSIRGFNTDHFREDKIYSHNKIKKLFSSFNPRVPNKLFDINFIRDKGLLFLETRIGEDNYFSCTCLSVADRIVVSHAILSKYRIRFGEDSLTGNRRVYLEDSVTMLRRLYKWLKDHSLLDIHLRDFFDRVNRTIYYNGLYGSTSGYISEMTHMLNAEEPWKDLSTEYIISILESSLFPYDDIRKYTETQERIEENKTVSERELYFQKIRKNRINTAELLRQTSKELYDRDFESAINKHRIPLNANENTGQSQVKTGQNNKPEVSVVIPMYNCEEFVPKLLKMFSGQSFTDFEVICVIDGATDGTEEAVKEYCKTDDRFRYVVRENGGAGAARNTGIDMAHGKYIVFPDADDLYEKDYILKLYKAAEEYDAQMALCGAVTYDYLAEEKRKLKGFNKKMMVEGKVYSSQSIDDIFKFVDTSNQNKMFLLDFIKSSGVRYSETPATNDLFFSKALLVLADHIVVVHDDLVTIRRFINPQSISSNRGVYSHIAVRELNKLYDWINDQGLSESYLSQYFWLFDITLNYEMKNGINALLAEETARTLNCEMPWINMNSGQIIQTLNRSFGEAGGEMIKEIPENITHDKEEKIKAYNDIIKDRNKSRACMQEQIKKASVDQYKRDFDDPNSKSPFYDADIISIQSEDHLEKTDDPQITVVIPMYNCADFVTEVLSMFAVQSFSDFEVICVIDGATDNTEELVRGFCKKDSRFRYVVQDNKGAGAARNTGLDLARGKYIVFSDADDEYYNDYLKKPYETAVQHDAQIVIFKLVMRNYRTDKETIIGFDEKRFCENIPYSHFEIDGIFGAFTSTMTNKMFNTCFLRDNGIRFPNTPIAEDAGFINAALCLSDRILVLNDVLKCYRLHINPGSNSGKRDRFQYVSVDILRMLYAWLKDHSLLEIHLKDYLRKVRGSIMYAGKYKITPRYISEIAHMLNAEEPWNNMTAQEIISYLEECIFADEAERKKEEIITKNSPHLLETDKALSSLYEYYSNRIRIAELLRQVSKERYGRDFDKERAVILRQGSPICFESTSLKVHWQITEECNYRCSYCFLAKKGYKKKYCTIEQAKNAIKHIASADRSSYQVSLLGGEPTLHPEFAEIIKLFCDNIGNKLERISLISNGNISEKAIDAINEASDKTLIELKVSIHFEFVQIEKLISLAEKLSDKVELVFLIMFHPVLFDKVKSVFESLCELRMRKRFKISIDLIREPPSFANLDSRYTEDHFSWRNNAIKRFEDVENSSGIKERNSSCDEGFIFTVDQKYGGRIVSEKGIDINRLDNLTGFNFSGMYCCAGTSILEITTDGTTRGMVCGLGSLKSNIFEENPFINEHWIYAVKCSKPRCNCNIDYRIPKFRDKKEAQAFIDQYREKQKTLT